MWSNESYLIFSVESLHVLHLDIRRKLKQCTVEYALRDITVYIPAAHKGNSQKAGISQESASYWVQ